MVRQVSKALEALAGAGIATYVYLLFGTPGESIEERGRRWPSSPVTTN